MINEEIVVAANGRNAENGRKPFGDPPGIDGRGNVTCGGRI